MSIFSKIAERFSDADEEFDPSQFDDPVAQETSWVAVTSSGTNYCTHTLKEHGASKVRFRPTIRGLLFALVFLTAGIGLLAHLALNFEEETQRIFHAIGGIIFIFVGIFLLHANAQPIVFDKQTGYFVKGRKLPFGESFDALAQHRVPLHTIYALQLLSHLYSSNNTTFYSYELNLILKDGDRVNVVDHGSHYHIRQDAVLLSQFLGKPLWDASN